MESQLPEHITYFVKNEMESFAHLIKIDNRIRKPADF